MNRFSFVYSFRNEKNVRVVVIAIDFLFTFWYSELLKQYYE